jgi:hypothetical protein
MFGRAAGCFLSRFRFLYSAFGLPVPADEKTILDPSSIVYTSLQKSAGLFSLAFTPVFT